MVSLIYDDLNERAVTYPTKFGDLIFHSDLPTLGNDAFGNIITGVLVEPVAIGVIRLLKKGNIKLDPMKIPCSESEVLLMRILRHMITSQCLLGMLTDGHISIFFLLKSLTKATSSNRVIEVDCYLDLCSKRADEDEKLTSRTFMIGLLGYVMGSGPLEYLKKKQQIFGNLEEWAWKPFIKGTHSPVTISAYCSTLQMLLQHQHLQIADLSSNREIVYNIPECNRLQYCEGHFQVFNIPRIELKHHINWGGNLDLMVVVFDPSISKIITNGKNEDSIQSELWIMLTKEIGTIQHFNQRFPANKINTAIIKIGFFSFWSDENKDLDSYIASGPTIIMEKLTDKPKTEAEKLMGLHDLVKRRLAGIDIKSISTKNMFMRDGDFVLCNYD